MANQNSNKTHCVAGHLLSGENLYIAPNGWRVCKTCNINAQKRYKLTKNGAKKIKVYVDSHKQEKKIAAAKRQREKRLYVYKIKSSPCTDCGTSYPPYVMDLDHVRGEKLSDVSSLIDNNVKLSTIIKEVAKCDVVCSNCHRIRTHERRGTII